MPMPDKKLREILRRLLILDAPRVAWLEVSRLRPASRQWIPICIYIYIILFSSGFSILRPNPSRSETCKVLLLAIVLLVHTEGLEWAEAVVGVWGCRSGDVSIQLFTLHMHA